MNKADLLAALQAETGATKAQAAAHLEAFTKVVSKTLANGGSIVLVGFGTFGTRVRKPRTGRNPQTGESIEIAGKTLPTFKAGKGLVASVN